MQKGNFFSQLFRWDEWRPEDKDLAGGGATRTSFVTCDLLLQFKVISVSCNLQTDNSQFTACPHVAAALSIAQKMAFKVLTTNLGSD